LEKPKSTIPISQLRSIVVNERGLLIKFVFVDGEKKIEKEWTLRLANAVLARKWYDKLQREKILDTARKSQAKSPQKSEIKEIRSKEPSPSRL
jgi:replication initiation and membrane attachment protein DnaB